MNEKQLARYLRAVRRRLSLSGQMKDRVMDDLRSSINERREAGQTDAEIFAALGPAKQAAAELAAQELGAQYPEFADQISENLAAFCEKLSSLQDYGEQALSDLSCRQLVTFHDGFSYFADAFSLTIAAAMEVESGSEPSAKELEEIISIVEENQIPAVFTEVNGETGAAEVVAGEAGCAVRTLDMAISNRDYFAAMRQNIDIVKEALG